MIRTIPSLCRSLLIALTASFLLTLLWPNFVYFLPVYRPVVYPGFQLWRLVTWPFLSNHLFSTISALLLIYFFGVELETIVHSKRLGIWLGLSTVIAGALFMLISPNGVLGGPAFLYFFVMTGFTYLWPEREISVFGFFFVKAWILSLLIFALAFVPLNGMQLDLSAANFFPPLSALTLSLLFFHTTYQQYSFGRRFLSSIGSILPKGSKPIRGRDATWGDKLSVEHRIDAILDKISRKGMDSLTKEEREFLLKNSAR